MFRAFLYLSTVFVLAVGVVYRPSVDAPVSFSAYLEQAAQLETSSQKWEQRLKEFEERYLRKESSPPNLEQELTRLSEARSRLEVALQALPEPPEAEEHRQMMTRRFQAAVAYHQELQRLAGGAERDFTALEEHWNTLEDARSQLFLWRAHHQP